MTSDIVLKLESVVIGSHHVLMAEGLAGLLKDGGCVDVRVAPSSEELLEATTEHKPDVVIIDGCMCGDGMRLVKSVAEKGHTVALVVGPEWSSAFVLEAIAAGAIGCLSYTETPPRFLASLALISDGCMVMSQDIGVRVVFPPLTKPPRVDPELLSNRENQIARMVSDGATNKEIAEALSLSEHTVKIHLGNILEKLNLRNRQQIAAHVAKQGNVQ